MQAWEEQLDGSKLVRYIYKGHDSAYTRDESSPQAPGATTTTAPLQQQRDNKHHEGLAELAQAPGGSLLRGNIIGGTALIDDVANKPYPNEVVLTARSKYVEWPLAELRQCAEIPPR